MKLSIQVVQTQYGGIFANCSKESDVELAARGWVQIGMIEVDTGFEELTEDDHAQKLASIKRDSLQAQIQELAEKKAELERQLGLCTTNERTAA